MALRRVRATWVGVAGSPAYLTAYFDGVEGNEQGDVDSLADFLEVVDDYQSNTVSWSTEAAVVYLDPVTGDPQAVATTDVRSGVGAQSDALLPPATQALLRLPTGAFHNGREVKGHWNLPYFTEAINTTTGTIDVPTATAIANAAALLATPGQDQLVIWSRTAGAVFPIGATPSVALKWAMLRSRRD